MGFDDIEVVTFAANVGIEAASLAGGTGFAGGQANRFEGLKLVDYDDVVDRNEELHLLQVMHVISVYENSTSTADGTISASVGISASPAITDETLRAARPDPTTIDAPVVGKATSDDTIDLVGRILVATGHAPFSDGPTGVGGGGSAGEDSYKSSMFPAEFGQFHPRDELFANGHIVTWNTDDTGVHVAINGQHVYGVLED